MHFTDRAPIAGVETRPNGFMVVNAKVSRGGNVQDYLGREVGRPDLGTVKVYRPEETVFDKSSAASFPHAPVTLLHPANGVTADSWSQDAVGWAGEEVMRDGEFIRVPMTIAAKRAIKAITDGHREISVGYNCQLIWEDGVAPDGTPYQAKQTHIVVDHIAIVPQGRAGPDCRVGDQGFPAAHPPTQPHGDQPMADNLRSVTVDSVTYPMTEQGAQLVQRLQGLLGDAGAALTTAQTTNDAALAAKDAELAKKDAEIADLKTKVLDGAALDALVAERSSIVAKAKSLDAKVITDGKSNAEIKRAVLGDAAKDKSDAYVDAAFDLKTADIKAPDPLRQIISDGQNKGGVNAASIRDAARLASLN